MGKKSKRTTYTSKGERRNISKSTMRLMREGTTELDKAMNKLRAWKKGKNPWITVKNTAAVSNRPYYKVKANDLWGDPRRTANIYKAKGEE